MPDIAKLREDLVRDEGCVLHAYTDSEGYLTIGIGRLIDDRRGGGISRHEAETLLDHDITRVHMELDSRIPAWRSWPEPVRRAFSNMAFNLGVPGLMRFRKMLAALQEEKWSVAADETLDSKWAEQVGDRSKRIADLMRSG